MRILIGLLAVSAAACGSDGDAPPTGGNGDAGTFPDGTLVDAATSIDAQTDSQNVVSDGAVTRMGRVCVTADPRKLNCESSTAGGLTVRLGSGTATTSATGAFTITGDGDVFEVTGPNIVTSHMPVGDYEIPAILTTTYTAMITNNLQGLTLNPGEGSVMVFVLSNGFGLSNAIADSDPSASWEPFYDQAAQQTTFVQSTTGADGMVWIPGLDVGTASVTVTALTDDFTIGDLPIFDGHITFATAIFPIP